MAINSEVYLECDSGRCKEKVSDDEYDAGDSATHLEQHLWSLAIADGWWEVRNDSLAQHGDSLMFHSEKCIRDYFLDLRKKRRAENLEFSDDEVPY